jgi:thioredoxin 1
MPSRRYKLTIVLILLLVILAGVAWKLEQRQQAGVAAAGAEPPLAALAAPKLPQLLEFGAGKCKQCKAMKPIIAALANEYEGRVRVREVDVFTHEAVARRYNVWTIPTQLFLDAEGNEVYRHEGFLPRADIIAQLNEMGVK